MRDSFSCSSLVRGFISAGILVICCFWASLVRGFFLVAASQDGIFWRPISVRLFFVLASRLANGARALLGYFEILGKLDSQITLKSKRNIKRRCYQVAIDCCLSIFTIYNILDCTVSSIECTVISAECRVNSTVQRIQ